MFLTDTQEPNLKKICPVEAKLFHADGRTDGRTDMKKLMLALRNSASAPYRLIRENKLNTPY